MSLQDLAALVVDASDRRAKVDALAGFDRHAHDVELGHRVLQVVKVQDHADPSDHAGRVGHDLVGRGRQIIGTARPQVEHRSDDGELSLGFERHQVMPHHIAGGDAAARTVDPHDHGHHAAVAGHAVEPLAKQRDRVFAHRARARHVGVEQQAVDVEDRHAGPADVARPGQVHRLDGLIGVGRRQAGGHVGSQVAGNIAQPVRLEPGNRSRLPAAGADNRHSVIAVAISAIDLKQHSLASIVFAHSSASARTRGAPKVAKVTQAGYPTPDELPASAPLEGSC